MKLKRWAAIIILMLGGIVFLFNGCASQGGVEIDSETGAIVE